MTVSQIATGIILYFPTALLTAIAIGRSLKERP